MESALLAIIAGLLVTLVGFIVMKERNIQKMQNLHVEMAKEIANTFAADALQRKEELQLERELVHRVLDDSKDDREKYLQSTQLFADRFMTADLKQLALYNQEQLKKEGDVVRVSDEELAYEEDINKVMSQYGVGREDAIAMIESAYTAEGVTSGVDAELMMRLRQQMTQGQLLRDGRVVDASSYPQFEPIPGSAEDFAPTPQPDGSNRSDGNPAAREPAAST